MADEQLGHNNTPHGRRPASPVTRAAGAWTVCWVAYVDLNVSKIWTTPIPSI
jgi:hypothetical protein